MTVQIIRQMRMVIGPSGEPGREVAGLRMTFDVTKQDGQFANIGKFSIYNADAETVAASRTRGSLVQCFAGYLDGGPQLLYLGEITRSETTREGVDRVTKLECGDGAGALKLSLTPRQITGGVDVLTGLKAAAAPLEQALGKRINLSAVASALEGQPSPFPRGLVLGGNAATSVNRICAAAKLDWMIEDGELVVMPRGQAVTLDAIYLDPDSIIGEPRQLERWKIEVKMLLRPEIRLRRIIVIRDMGPDWDGWYLTRSVRHAGDAGWSPEFYTTVEATRIDRPPTGAATSRPARRIPPEVAGVALFDKQYKTLDAARADAQEVANSYKQIVNYVRLPDNRYILVDSTGLGVVTSLKYPAYPVRPRP